MTSYHMPYRIDVKPYQRLLQAVQQFAGQAGQGGRIQRKRAGSGSSAFPGGYGARRSAREVVAIYVGRGLNTDLGIS